MSLPGRIRKGGRRFETNSSPLFDQGRTKCAQIEGWFLEIPRGYRWKGGKVLKSTFLLAGTGMEGNDTENGKSD